MRQRPGPSQGGKREGLAEERGARADALVGQRPDHLGRPGPRTSGQSGAAGREHRVVQSSSLWSLSARGDASCASFYVYRSTYTVLRSTVQALHQIAALIAQSIAQFDGGCGLATRRRRGDGVAIKCKKRARDDPHGGGGRRRVGRRGVASAARRLWRQRCAARQGPRLDRASSATARTPRRAACAGRPIRWACSCPTCTTRSLPTSWRG